MNGKLGAAARDVCLMTAALALAACHGSSSTSSNGTYTIGGTISGLNVGAVVLVENGGATVDILAGATTWVFPNSFAAGSSYSISVQTQPIGGLCEVTGGGSGVTLGGNVDNVTVACGGSGQWTWEGGLSTANGSGVYGTQFAAAASNVPGARYDSSSWTDSSGNFWMFGGYGYDALGVLGALDDLWEYNPSTGLWTWISGGAGINASGVYGTQGTPAAGNLPGARYSASSWIDSLGNLWLFGGYGYDSAGVLGYLDDLWQYDRNTGEWTWISGVNGENANGVYGTQGAAAASNLPGARYAGSSWIDSSSNLWLFGGTGYAASGGVGNLNDLWRYTPGSGWTWISGGNGVNASGVYGTPGVAAASNVPRARQSATAWMDPSGNLWLFGGYGYDSSSGLGYLNDMWQYAPLSGEWTWVGGGSGINANGVYGTQSSAAASNQPGAREAADSWIDASGNVWLFGGIGYAASGGAGYLDDMWRYSTSSGQWTWISGGNEVNIIGVYGRQGIISSTIVPGGRQAASSWTDSSGNMWLFGGVGYSSTSNGYLNDLWQFTPP